MKLTCHLLKQSQRRMWKSVWKLKGSFQDRPPKISEAVIASGISIVDPVAKAELPRNRWISAVPDDQQFQEKTPSNEWSNFNEHPAYVYTRAQRMMEGLKQACILTKSVQFQGFPESIQPLIGNIPIKNQDKLLQRYIMQSQVWDPSQEKLPKRIDISNVGYKFVREYGIHKSRRIDILLRNMIRLCRSTCVQYPSVLSNLKLIPDPFFCTHFDFRDRLVIIQGFGKYMLLSNKPFKPFVGEERIDESINERVPDMYPLSPFINLVKSHNYTIQNVIGFEKESSHSYPHTIFLKNLNFWSDELRQASALLICFGQALTHAKRLYGNEVTQLPQPVCVQCVNMDEATLNFTFFQLNTMNISSNDGIKNFVWFDSSNHLFQKRLPQPWLGPEHLSTHRYNFNPVAFHKLLALFLANTPELDVRAKENSV